MSSINPTDKHSKFSKVILSLKVLQVQVLNVKFNVERSLRDVVKTLDSKLDTVHFTYRHCSESLALNTHS